MNIGIYIEPIIQQKGGIRRYTEDLVKGLERFGSYNYTLIGSAEIDSSLPQQVVSQAALPIYHPSRHRGHFKSDSFDLLIDPSHFGSWGLFPAQKRVVCIHDLSGVRFPEYHRWQTAWAHRLLLSTWVGRSIGLFTVSECMRDEIHLRFPKINPAVITPGTEFLNDACSEPQEKLPARFFLFLGATEPRKNLSRVLAALTELPEDVHLVMTGPEGWKFELAEEVSALSLEDRVHHLGYKPRNELNHLLKNAIALIYPSIYEGFGLPVLEAMWAGCPVLTTKEGAPSALTQGAGVKVDPLDTSSIRSGMQRLIDDASLRSVCADAGRQRSQAFRWELSVARFETYLGSLIKR